MQIPASPRKYMLEKDVEKECDQELNQWESEKVIIHYDNLSNAGRKQVGRRWVMITKKGRPDRVIYLNVNKTLVVLFLEYKTKTGSAQDSQIEFMMKFQGIANVYYEFATTRKETYEILERITGHYKDKLSGIKMDF